MFLHGSSFSSLDISILPVVVCFTLQKMSRTTDSDSAEFLENVRTAAHICFQVGPLFMYCHLTLVLWLMQSDLVAITTQPPLGLIWVTQSTVDWCELFPCAPDLSNQASSLRNIVLLPSRYTPWHTSTHDSSLAHTRAHACIYYFS